MKALSHEVVEILTDPEGTAWRTGSADRGRCEISDAGVSVSGGVSTSQTAFVSGVHVQSYWSVNDNATIIPIDGGYQAQLKSHVREVGRNIFASGQFNTVSGVSAIAIARWSGGAVAGAPGGHPLQLLFWGDWWNGPGATKCGLVEVRTRALLESGYFSELLQYGVPRAPVWRGSLIVTGPAPPSSVDWCSITSTRMPEDE